MLDDPVSRIEAALEAGPTPGYWDADFASAMRNGSPAVVEYFVRRDGEDISIAADIVDPETGLPSAVNADYIAACNPLAIRVLLDRLKAAEAEVGRLKCNAMQWRKPGPVTAEHPLDCLIVVPALRQADGDWWLEGSKFLSDDAPIAWCADTSIARSALENTNGK